jgi:DNA-binding GntR family transcriptional regulator
MILSVALPPGVQFSEAQISSELAIGKTPVREALARLQREELVECIPRSGYRVATLTLKDVRDLFAVRVLLESESVRLASGREYDAGQLRRLEKLSTIDYAVDEPDKFARAIAENTEFHVLLAQGSGNRRLVTLMREVMEHMERVLHIAISVTAPAGIGIDREHPDLLRAVLRGDGEGARQIVEAQNRAWQDRMIDILLSSEAVLSTNLSCVARPAHHLTVLA